MRKVALDVGELFAFLSPTLKFYPYSSLKSWSKHAFNPPQKIDKSTIYRGPTAPLTSLTFNPTSTTLFATCWDKTIHSWSLTTRTPLHRYVGHSDFVKCVLCIRLQNTDFLISGSADASIIIWSIAGSKLHVLKGHTRGIQHLALDPTTYDFSGTGAEVVIFSAGSDREIRRWLVTPTSASQIYPAEPIIEHETSVYRLRFDADDNLWTASADGTVKCLVRERGWKPDTILQHPDFVRDVIVTSNWAITACRDEGVRVWDISVHFPFFGNTARACGVVADDKIDGEIISHFHWPPRRSYRPCPRRPHHRQRQHRRHNSSMVSGTLRFGKSAHGSRRCGKGGSERRNSAGGAVDGDGGRGEGVGGLDGGERLIRE